MRHVLKTLALVGLLTGPMAVVIALFGISTAYAEELAIVPVVDGEVLYQEIYDVGDEYSNEDIFRAIKASLDAPTLHRKLGQEESIPGLLFGVRVSPQMAGVEASHRNRETVISESPPNQLRYSLYQHYAGKGTASKVRTMYVDSRLDIDVKPGRYRVIIKDFEWEHWNHFTASQQPIWTSKTPGCGVRGTLYELQNVCSHGSGSREKLFLAIDEDVKTLMAKLYESVKKELANPDSSGDW